jgi:hypothetical protein
LEAEPRIKGARPAIGLGNTQVNARNAERIQLDEKPLDQFPAEPLPL